MLIVVVAALGYFVDIVDLFLFNVVRSASLLAIGIPESELMLRGTQLLNTQMTGLLVGAFLWGILGDRKGRISVLYGSIALYSLATLANGWVNDFSTYVILRFLAGVGLAGELGAAITLVSESLPIERRGLGTTIVAGVGLSGGIVAALMAELMDWRTCYWIGGGMGLGLLALRMTIKESAIYAAVAHKRSRGNIFILFQKPHRLLKYFQLIAVGVPIWFVAGILIFLSPEFAKELGVTGPVKTSLAVLYSYAGVALGDFASGLLSQRLKSRKKALGIFIAMVIVGIIAYYSSYGVSVSTFYGICFFLGLGTGYWAVLITTASEHFGTDLRATVTTSVPNLIRASVIPMNLLLGFFREYFNLIHSSQIVGAIGVVFAIFSLTKLSETFSVNLQFTEGDS